MKFKITNLDCKACIKLSEMALKGIDGVTSAKVDLKSGIAEVESTKEISWDKIVEALKTVNKNPAQIN